MVSHAQNHEDVVLWRALRNVADGKYVDVGANDPTMDSVTRTFYDLGWRGVTVEPMQTYAERHREQRPDDILIEAAVTNESGGMITLHQFEGTGLSTTVDEVSNAHRLAGMKPVEITVPTRRLDDILEATGWAPDEIHFMTIDVEGAEAEVLRSLDLAVWRPWVLLIEAATPELMLSTDGPVRPQISYESWEPAVLAAGYSFCLFDGVSRFYVANEHADDLATDLSYPACVLDNFIPAELYEAQLERDKNLSDLRAMTDTALYWRATAVSHWAEATARGDQPTDGSDAQALRAELAAMRSTVSWRVTAPLRAVRKSTRARAETP